MLASASCVALTPPSMLFSIAIIAPTLRPEITSSRASPTLLTERQTWSFASGTWVRAAQVKVPAGPR